MKIASLLTAAALVLTSAAVAGAAPMKKGAKMHKHRAHTMTRQMPPQPRDPYQGWVNDPTRNSFPSYSRGAP